MRLSNNCILLSWGQFFESGLSLIKKMSVKLQEVHPDPNVPDKFLYQ